MATRVVFMGTPSFALPSLRALLTEEAYHVVGVLTQPDRPAGRGRKLTASPVKRLALEHGVEIAQPSTLRSPEPVTTLERWAPELVVVAAYGLILPAQVLQIPYHGCINVHASMLPRHRGAAPVAAAILAGDPETGVTIMLMDEGLDTGPILTQAAHAIGAQDTTESLTGELAHRGAESLQETLPGWLSGEITPVPQREEWATYAPMLCKADRAIDWTLPAAQLARRVRAHRPWPGSVTLWEGQQLRLLEVDPLRDPACRGQPGDVVQWGDGAAVVTGNGLLRLRRLQLAGKSAMPVAEFLRGRPSFLGSHLDTIPFA